MMIDAIHPAAGEPAQPDTPDDARQGTDRPAAPPTIREQIEQLIADAASDVEYEAALIRLGVAAGLGLAVATWDDLDQDSADEQGPLTAWLQGGPRR